MLTPAFELSQDHTFLTIFIKVPYAKGTEKDVHFEDNDFTFYCKPYYLRLNLPGRVCYEEEPAAVYDIDKGTLTIKMKKSNPGEHFEGLELLTKLLAPKGKSSSSAPLIEVINDSSCQDEACGGEDEDEFDWFIDQAPTDEENVLFLGNPNCGFADLHSCCVFKLKEEVNEIFDIVDPEAKPAHILLQERLLSEFKQFDPEHYLGDLYEDEDIEPCLKFSPEWSDLSKKGLSPNPDETIHFSTEEKEKLRNLPNKEYLIDKSETQKLYFGLIDILFAYAYDKRTTLGESTVESGWTINKLSSTLTWLEKFSTLKSVLESCIRRSLCYPLYRNWDLAMRVLKDVQKILSLGRKYVLKCLLVIHTLFNASDPRYILNDLFITDYCVWIQSKSCRTKVFVALAEAIGKVEVKKEDLGLDLVELEEETKILIMQEQNATDSPTNNSARQNISSEVSASNSDTGKTGSLNARSPLIEKSIATCLMSRFEGISISDSSCLSQSTSSPIIKSNVQNAGITTTQVNIQTSDDSSDSSSSSNCSSNTITETDSDGCSSSSDSYTDGNDSESTNGNEHSHLLKKDKL